ncbi:PAS domain S-box protein [candidate division KSB1 bacterium]|nr:PAS domain S-box protein [candidate division KSB1 bacterium]
MVTTKPSNLDGSIALDPRQLINNLRSELINIAIIGSAVLLLPAIVISLYRIVTVGWQPIMLSHICLYALMVVIAFYRKRLSLRVRIILFISIVLTSGVWSLLQWGLIGMGIVLFVITNIFTTYFLSARWGFFSTIISSLIIAVIAFLVHKGIIIYGFDISAYAVASSSWIFTIVAFWGITSILVHFVGKFYNSLTNLIHELNEHTVKLDQTNIQLQQEIIEHKATQQSLQASEQRIRTLIEYTTDAVFCYEYFHPISTDLPADEQIDRMYDGVLVDCNNICANSLGYNKAHEIINKKLSDLFDSKHHSMHKLFKTLIENNYRTENAESCEKLNDGSSRYFLNRGYGIIEHGKLLRIWGTFRDVTEQKQADRITQAQLDLALALSSSHGLDEILKSCVDSALKNSGLDSGGIYLIDNETGDVDLAYSNGLSENFIAKVTHYNINSSQGEIIMKGNPIYTMYEKTNVVNDIEKQHEHLKAIAIIPIRHENKVIACLNLASHTLGEVPEFSRRILEIIAANIGNVIARTRAEKALRENMMQFKIITDTAQDSIFIKDTQYNYRFINPAMAALLGSSPENIVGKNTEQVFGKQAAEIIKEVDDQVLQAGIADEVRTLNISDDAITFHTVQVPIKELDGKISGICGIVRNITELQKAKNELKRHQEHLEDLVHERTLQFETANKELKQFAYIVSHDLKTPLRAVIQLATWISQDYKDVLDDDGKEQLELLVGRVQRMDNLINGILEYSRIGRLETHTDRLDLNKIVKHVINSLEHSDAIKIEVENKLPVVHGNRIRFEQLFQNLLSNSIKYMDKPNGNIRIACEDLNNHWRFRIQDNGPGIDKKYHKRIFQIFQTLQPRDQFESTGIGLSIVKKIIEQYNGEIWIESEIGKGSTFYFTIDKNV